MYSSTSGSSDETVKSTPWKQINPPYDILFCYNLFIAWTCYLLSCAPLLALLFFPPTYQCAHKPISNIRNISQDPSLSKHHSSLFASLSMGAWSPRRKDRSCCCRVLSAKTKRGSFLRCFTPTSHLAKCSPNLDSKFSFPNPRYSYSWCSRWQPWTKLWRWASCVDGWEVEVRATWIVPLVLRHLSEQESHSPWFLYTSHVIW